jgi:hypothetical protein
MCATHRIGNTVSMWRPSSPLAIRESIRFGNFVPILIATGKSQYSQQYEPSFLCIIGRPDAFGNSLSEGHDLWEKAVRISKRQRLSAVPGRTRFEYSAQLNRGSSRRSLNFKMDLYKLVGWPASGGRCLSRDL